jgi:putative alpha-1,2-mannosidase
MSGYPNGSAGQVKVMPVVGRVAEGRQAGAADGSQVTEGRSFRHADEKASPGYYKVGFYDGTVVEATASERVGVFRICFPAGSSRQVFAGGMGKIVRRSPQLLYGAFGVAVQFDRAFVEEQVVDDGLLLSFPAGVDTLIIRVSASSVSEASALKNIKVDIGGLSFDEVRERTRAAWKRQLGVIEVDDERDEKKKIFYTALYHAALLPWIISDVDGQYRGRDGLVHQTRGQHEYGGFSAWDTFRSLHPLLCLLFPQRQRDMVLSLLDIYRQTGYLPTDPMTGNHAVAVIADSWMKGIRGFDSIEALAAMRKGVIDTPYLQADRGVYRQLGYIPSTYPESVTRTVEYAYDDWVVAWFDRRMRHRYTGEIMDKGGRNYLQLFDPDELFLLPRDGGQFNKRPGNSGYKEGDKWVYSFFAPQAPRNLVNLMGGGKEFTNRLDGALKSQDILFDNETVFHIPYLFNYAGDPGKTQEWVSAIRDRRFAASPGGLPGNDDLGSMSSWYIFSALGFYPVCPGRADYDIGTPLFRKVTLHLAGGRDLVIKAPGVSAGNKYVRRVRIKGRGYDGLQLSHELLVKGGEIEFGMDSVAVPAVFRGPAFSFSDVTVSSTKVMSNELFRVRWRVTNHGSLGTRIVRLRGVGYKNCLAPAGATIVDSMDCRLYALGKHRLEIEGTDWQQEVEVVKEGAERSVITGLFVRPLVQAGKKADIFFNVRNIGGVTRTIVVPVSVNGGVVSEDTVLLEPGEEKRISDMLPVFPPGWQQLQAGDVMKRFRVYGRPEESVLLDLSLNGTVMNEKVVNGEVVNGKIVNGKIVNGEVVNGEVVNGEVVNGEVVDRSGFDHHARVEGKGFPLFGKDCFVEIPNAAVLDSVGETLTMMAWVYPTEKGDDLVDIFTKGDNHVLQVSGNSRLSFFAGGWGRGDCTVDLPADWWGHWHHIAGVCEGSVLRVYIDGVEKGMSRVDGSVNLSVSNRWVLGRNEEFPGQRVFHGYIDGVKVFSEPLTSGEIMHLFQSSGAPPSPRR